jgi:hypothetical protein
MTSKKNRERKRRNLIIQVVSMDGIIMQSKKRFELSVGEAQKGIM